MAEIVVRRQHIDRSANGFGLSGSTELAEVSAERLRRERFDDSTELAEV